MSNDWESSEDERLILTAIPAAAQKKGRPVLAWIVIVLLVGLIVGVHAVRSGGPQAVAEGPRIAIDLRTMEVQARYLVGAKDLFKESGKGLMSTLQMLNSGPVPRRLRFSVLAGELEGPAEARVQLNRLDAELAEAGIHETPDEAALHAALRRLYDDYARGQFNAPSLTDEQRAKIRNELGWFGQFALAPAEGPDKAARAAVLAAAQRTLLTLLGYVVGLGILGLLGLVGLVTFLILLLSGKLRRGIHTGLWHGGVYAETFAVWMALFLALSVVAALIPSGEASLLPTGLAFLFSLAALSWPVLRGIPWRQVRWEIGLTLGRRPALGPVLGIATYAMAIPLLALGALVTLGILEYEGAFHGGGTENQFTPVQAPSHPVMQYVIGHDWWARLQVLFLASVIAPLVEETVFRGALYRHLREGTARLGRALSIFFSALLVSFLFAVIHPYPLEFVPILMGLAFAFCLVREWQGTLLPAMVAHGIFNGVTLLLVILVMGD